MQEALLRGELLSHSTILAIVLGIVFFIFVIKQFTGFKYKAHPTLLTACELNFYRQLEKALPGQFALTTKVRMADIVQVDGIGDKRSRFKAFAKISQKHIDFVICNKNDFSIVCCIELNDKSHQARDRRNRDLFVRSCLGEAGVPLIEIPAKKYYPVKELKSQLADYLLYSRAA